MFTAHYPRTLRTVVVTGLLGLGLGLALGTSLTPASGAHAPQASAVTSSRSLLLVNADGTTYPALTLLSAPFRTAGPVTMVWKVASADTMGMPSRFAVALLDAQGRTQARLADTTRAVRDSATIIRPECLSVCRLSISVANMHYALVGYTLAPAR
jgi:hypothetical protein